MSSYRTDEIRFPFLSRQTIGGIPFKFMMTNERSVNWYGLPGVVEANHEYLELIQSRSRIIDCGANEGYIAILAALKAGPSGRVMAIEPAPHNLEPLNINIALNQLEDRITLIPKAVSDVEGEIGFIAEAAVATGISVPAITLDSLIYFAPQIIKLDVEGFELKALRGGVRLLREFRPLIFLETHLGDQNGGVDMRAYGDQPEDLYKLMTELGYVFYKDSSEMDACPSGACVLRHKDSQPATYRPVVKIPPAFCLTMLSTPERTSAMVEHLIETGFLPENLHVMDGVDGKRHSLSVSKWSKEFKHGEPYYCSPGQIGLIFSHRQAWNTIWAMGLDEAIVFEDDVLLDADFLLRFPFFYEALPKDWQFVYIGTYDTNPEAVRVNDHITIDEPFRTHAYMIRRSAIPALNAIESATNHIDVLIRAHALPQLKHYCFSPSQARQRTAEGHWVSVAI